MFGEIRGLIKVAITSFAFALVGCGGSGGGDVAQGDTYQGRPNSPPILEVSQNLETDEDTPVTLDIPVSDADLDILSFQVVEEPEHGVVSFTTGTSPSFTYTPERNYNGSDAFKYQASDNQSTSETATVTINVRPIDDPVVVQIAEIPPLAALTIIDLTAEILDVDGDGDTAVPIGWEVPTIDGNGFLWKETVDEYTVRVRTPSYPTGATLSVTFSATADDGSIVSDSKDVVVQPGPDYDSDGVTDFLDTDDDADGWADFVERQLGSDTLSAESQPFSEDPRLLNLDIAIDSDSDGISDVQEEAWGRDPFDPRSVPPDSDKDGFPDHARHLAIGRAVPFNLELGLPMIMAAEPNARVFDVGDGTAELQVTFTAVSPVPITDIELALQIIETNSSRTLLQFFDRGIFPISQPRNIVAGTISMPLNEHLPPSDFRTILVGNSVGFDYRGRPSDEYLQSFLSQTPGTWSGDTRITIENSGSVDSQPPTITGLSLQNSVIDVATNERALTYDLELTDDLSGVLIHQLRVTQTTGATYNRATDTSFHLPASKLVQYGGTTNDITRDILTGVLGGLDFIITDFAGNEAILSPGDLFDLGLPYYVDLQNSEPDPTGPNLESFEILTDTISRRSGGRVELLIGASDQETDIREVVAVFHKRESYSSFTFATFHIGREFEVNESTESATVNSEPLGEHIHAGVYEIYSLTVFDRNDRRTDLLREDLLAQGFGTQFQVTR